MNIAKEQINYFMLELNKKPNKISKNKYICKKDENINIIFIDKEYDKIISEI